MSSSMSNCSNSLPRAARLLSLAAVLTVISLQSTSRADIGTLGDVNVAVDPFGYVAGTDTGDLIIGNSFVGGLSMDVALQPDPLRSTTGTIGNNDSVVGRATFTGIPSDWLIDTDLVVGNEGQGFLDLFNSALVQVGNLDYMTMSDTMAGTGLTTIGAFDTGYGEVTINGVASRLATADLLVGDLGFGKIIVTQRGALFSGDSTLGNGDGSNGEVSVIDSGSRWTVGDSTISASLTIGNGTGIGSTGQGTLNIALQGLVQVAGSTFINRDGRVNLSTGGRLRKLPSAPGLISVNGVLSGDGFVDGLVVVLPLGQIRNAAGIANTREKLVFSGPVDNFGTIEILGGEMDFNSTLTNNLEIVVRDGVLRFPLGLDNTGSISVGGDSTLHGTINFNGGSLNVLSNSDLLVVGDLRFTSAGILGLTAGPAAGTLDITGMADLTGAFVSLGYSAGVLPQAGDSYQLFKATDGITGFVPQQAAAGGLLWNIDMLGTTDTLFATATAAVAAPFGADFNGDGIVNQLDLQVWQANFGRTSPPDLSAFGDADGDGDVDGRDLLEIQRKFGGPPLVAAATAVPEPSALVLLLGVVALLGQPAVAPGWRRR